MNDATQSLSWMTRWIAAMAVVVLARAVAAAPQAASPADSTSDRTPESLLGEPFENRVAGIAFRAPAGCKQTKTGRPDDIAEYANEERSWVLRVTRTALGSPVALDTEYEADGSIRRDAQQQPKVGFIDFVADQLKASNPGTEVLRKDHINIGKSEVGLVVVRFTLGTQRFLRQQALVQAGEQLYYVLNFTTPAGKSEPEVGKIDPADRLAVETFGAVLDTVRVLDRAPIKADQDQRLYRTRALFLNWNERMFRKVTHNTEDEIINRKLDQARRAKAADRRSEEAPLAAGQHESLFRIVENGRDVGWTYQAELIENRDGKDGLCVYVRAHRQIDATHGADIGSNMFMTFDRRTERYVHASVTVDSSNRAATQPVRTYVSEVGIASWHGRLAVTDADRPEKNREKAPADKDKGKDKDEGAIQPRVMKDYGLDVTVIGKSGTAAPIHKDLPAWYVPQSAATILYRLVPLNEPKGYLFAVYVSERQEVMHRYVDVSAEQEFTFNGQRSRGIVVTDRVRLDGTPTLHYFTLQGEYLGSETREAKLMILPSSEQWLVEHGWKLNFSRPAGK